MGKMGQNAHGLIAPYMYFLPHMSVLPLLAHGHFIFMHGRFALHPLGILPL